MLRLEDVRYQKMMEVFEEMGLSEKELEIIEKYIEEEAGEDSLSQLVFRDLEKLSQQAKQKARDLWTSLYTKKRYEELKKYFKVLFALGQATCYVPMSNNIYGMKDAEFRKQLDMSVPQCVAIYAGNMGASMWGFRVNRLSAYFEVAEHSVQNLVKALSYCKGENATGKLLTYTLYFWKKYKEAIVPQNTSAIGEKEAASEKGGFLGTISKLFGGRKDESESIKKDTTVMNYKIEVQDMEWMHAYESILLNSLDGMFQALSQEDKEKLRLAVGKGEITAELKTLVKGTLIDEKLLEILAGCAFLNYDLSPVLKAVAVLCLTADTGKTLDTFANMNGRDDLEKNGGNYDDIFGIEAFTLISWAANQGQPGMGGYNYYGQRLSTETAKKVLSEQFRKNPQIFLEYQKEAPLEAGNLMLQVIKEADEALYRSLLGSGADAQKEKVIETIVLRLSNKKECQEYLRGNTEVDTLYGIQGILSRNNYYGGANEWNALKGYYRTYQDKEFYNRTLVLMACAEHGYFFRQPINESGKNKPIEVCVADIFKSLQEGKLNKAGQLRIFTVIYDTLYAEKDKFIAAGIPVFREYLEQEPNETKRAFAEAEAMGRCFGLQVLEQDASAYKAEILSFSQDSAKMVKEKLQEILKARPEWQEEIRGLLNSKKAVERELAIQVLSTWNKPEDMELLKGLLNTEKNAKVRNLLESVLGTVTETDGEGKEKKHLSTEELVKNLHKGGKKRSLAWAYETPFSEVHSKNGEVLTEEYLQGILLCYSSMTTPGVSGDAKVLAEEVNEAEMATYVNELFDKWLEAGAEAKKRWVMYVASIHGGSDMVKKLYHQIQEWPENARGAIAADAVQALALSPQPQALLLVDGIARKFKFKQVKAAAGKALEFAAAQLGLTREELEDKIVPDLGFDENMERRFDYGERCFTVTITPALEIEVFDESGKKLKNLPAPGKKDDEEKANAAYTDFKEMKKQMKTTVSSQKMRLEAALSSERLWSIEAWQELFVKNPVMHQFAIGLIWGIYEEHKLTQSFRYMEDGSFNTEDEDEYTLPEKGFIGLVHPIELSTESRDAWKQQLEDYEIKQPFEQLVRPVFYRTEEEEKCKSMERFGGMYVNDLSLSGKLQQLGWYRGEALDAGCFDTFYRTDSGLDMRTELHFSGTYIGCQNEDVTVYEARFYKMSNGNGWGYHIADEAKDTKALPLKDIPERYFSEIVLQLTKATASSKERSADWKKDR